MLGIVVAIAARAAMGFIPAAAERLTASGHATDAAPVFGAGSMKQVNSIPIQLLKPLFIRPNPRVMPPPKRKTIS